MEQFFLRATTENGWSCTPRQLSISFAMCHLRFVELRTVRFRRFYSVVSDPASGMQYPLARRGRTAWRGTLQNWD